MVKIVRRLSAQMRFAPLLAITKAGTLPGIAGTSLGHSGTDGNYASTLPVHLKLAPERCEITLPPY